jgi:hypothetical protein
MRKSRQNLLKDMISQNVKCHDKELFELDNQIKKLREKIKLLQKKIYKPVENSIHYKDLLGSFREQQKQSPATYNLLMQIKSRQLCRYHDNSKRIIKMKIF